MLVDVEIVETYDWVGVLVLNKCEDGDKDRYGGHVVHGYLRCSRQFFMRVVVNIILLSGFVGVGTKDNIVLLVIRNGDSDDGDGDGGVVGRPLNLASLNLDLLIS